MNNKSSRNEAVFKILNQDFRSNDDKGFYKKKSSTIFIFLKKWLDIQITYTCMSVMNSSKSSEEN